MKNSIYPKLEKIELFEVHLPLVHPFVTSFGKQEINHGIIVQITDEDGNVGWGETTVMDAPSYCYETVKTAWHIQTEFLIPRLKNLNKDQFSYADLENEWHPIRGHEFAKGGIEASLWSLLADSTGKNLGDLYGSTKDEIPTGVSIGIQKNTRELLDRIESFLNQGYQRIKIKIKPGWDKEIVKAVRQEFGDIDLMVDANSAYSLEDSEILKELDQYELMMIEQPLAYNDILQHRKLQEQLNTPICLDESIHNPRDAALALEYECCRIINIKPGRVGGYANAIEIAENGGAGSVWCGGMLESGIGRLHNIYLQARDEFTIPGDTSGSDRYYKKDIIEPRVIVNDKGYIEVPKDSGLGYQVMEDRIEVYTKNKTEFPLSKHDL